MRLDKLLLDVQQLEEHFHQRSAPDPVDWACEVTGYGLDAWQCELLNSASKRTLLVAARQSGKSEVCALKAAYEFIFRPGAKVVCLSPTQRQSANLFDRLAGYVAQAGIPLDIRSRTHLRATNGNEAYCLPGSNPDMVRGLVSTHTIIDEAAYVDDRMLPVVLPMAATTQGAVTCLTTPCGQQGAFYEAWASAENWTRIQVDTYQCPRHTDIFRAEMKRKLGDVMFSQEMLCEFRQAAGAYFSTDAVAGAFERGSSVEPLNINWD